MNKNLAHQEIKFIKNRFQFLNSNNGLIMLLLSYLQLYSVESTIHSLFVQ